MAQILVRDLDDDCVRRLKNLANQNGRSLETEAKLILERAMQVDMSVAREMADRMRAKLGERFDLDSVEILRELRDA